MHLLTVLGRCMVLSCRQEDSQDAIWIPGHMSAGALHKFSRFREISASPSFWCPLPWCPACVAGGARHAGCVRASFPSQLAASCQTLRHLTADGKYKEAF